MEYGWHGYSLVDLSGNEMTMIYMCMKITVRMLMIKIMMMMMMMKVAGSCHC